jgi:hypothetical protein
MFRARDLGLWLFLNIFLKFGGAVCVGARSLVAEILACGCSGAKGQATNTEYQILRPFTARILHKKYSTCSKNLHVVQSRI